MSRLKHSRRMFAITPPAAIVDAAAVTTAIINTAGFKLCIINVLLGATDIAVAALKVQESDDSGMSGAVDITDTVVGTAVNDTGVASTLPSATADNKFFQFVIRCGAARKQFLDLVLTGGDGSAGAYFVAWAELWDGEIDPITALECNVSQRFLVN